MLHVVNGDETARSIRESGLLKPLDPTLKAVRDPDHVIAWRDVLYEGPVRAGLSPVNLAHERSQFIASRGWEPYISVRQNFAHRDSAIASTKRQDEVIYWFESDLYDLLQLVQALDRLAARRPDATAFSWVLVDRRGEKAGIHGFGRLTPDEVEALLKGRQSIPDSAWTEARLVWTAFTGDDPGRLQELRDDGSAGTIPFLADGLDRLLAEFPDSATGLSRSERQILEAVQAGERTPDEIFAAAQAAERRPFLGDLQVWERLEWFASSVNPLIRRVDGGAWVSPVVDLMSLEDPDTDAFRAQKLQLTQAGNSVLSGVTDWLAVRPSGRWLGGYEIPGEHAWRYDSANRRLDAPTGSAPKRAN